MSAPPLSEKFPGGLAAEKRWGAAILRKYWRGVRPMSEMMPDGEYGPSDFFVTSPIFPGLPDRVRVEVKWWPCYKGRNEGIFGLVPWRGAYLPLTLKEGSWTTGPFPAFLLIIAERRDSNMFSNLPYYYIVDLRGLEGAGWCEADTKKEQCDCGGWHRRRYPENDKPYRLMFVDSERVVAEQPQPGNPYPMMRAA